MKVTKEEIYAAFNIPAEIANFLEASTEESYRTFCELNGLTDEE